MPLKDPEARREYRRLYFKSWYDRNKQKHIAYVKRNTLERAREAAALKDGPCTDCGGRFPPCVMDWDHVSGEKFSNVANYAKNGSRQKLLEEIAKCELVCANCHRIRTHNRVAVIESA